MTGSKRISHSAWSKYMTCPEMYNLHYNMRLRPTGTSSSLLFGVAIDEALNALLLDKGDPLEVFRQNFPPFDETVSLHKTDIDVNILDDSQRDKIRGMKPYEQAWACLRVKGRILLEAYEEIFYPQIEKVIDVQRNLQDRPGVVDAIVKLRSGDVVLIDHKTASRPYTKDSLLKSTQLALYASNQKIKTAGFVVLLKQIPKSKICSVCGNNGTGLLHKTCNKTVEGVRCHGKWDYSIDKSRAIQVIIGDVPKVNAELYESSVRHVERAIKDSIYPRNLNACNWIYGQPCPYIDYCWNGKKQGLEKKETK